MLSALPKRVTIELTNRCNRSCSECPRHKMTSPLGDMPWHLFTKIMDELPPETVMVPFFRGESLLYPRFADAMEKLQKFNEVQLATNGDYLALPNSEAVLNSVSFISLSLHRFASPRQTNGVEFLHAANNRGLDTQVSILDGLIPEGETNRFADAWLRHVDRVRVYKEHSHNGFGDLSHSPKDDGRRCLKPWTDMVIYWDGNVALCNHDWDNRSNLGNVAQDSIEHVWRSKGYIQTRVAHMTGNRRLVKSCRNCDYYSGERIGELYTN